MEQPQQEPYPSVAHVAPYDGKVFTTHDTVLPISNYIDCHGEETDKPELAVSIVAGPLNPEEDTGYIHVDMSYYPVTRIN